VLQVRGDFAKFIGPDSRVVLKFDLGGLGAAFFDISRGSEPFPLSTDQRVSRILAFAQEANAKEQAFETFKRVENELIPAIKSFRELSATSTALVERLSKDDQALFRLLSSLEVGVGDLNKIIGQIQSGDGALGDMISSDSEMRKQFNEFAITLNRSSTSLEKAIANLDQGITRFREGGVEPLNRAVEKLPMTVDSTTGAINEYNEAALLLQEAIREIEILTIGLQKHWLVKNLIVDPVEDQPKGSAAARSKENQTSRSKPSEGEKQDGLFKGLFKKKGSP
jgi:exonuclease VII small subunit